MSAQGFDQDRGPATGEPSLEGDLRHFFPSEVLQLLQLSHSTGRLDLERGGERVQLLVERGRPVFARTTGTAVRAGEVLVHRGIISPEVLTEALAAQADNPGLRLGSLLMASGHCTPDQVREAVREVLRRIVYGVLLWRDGRFGFTPGQQAVDEDIQLDLALDRLIIEAMRIADQERAGRV